MKLLLDTHCFLWFVLDDPQLSSSIKAEIERGTTDVLISPASYWEIAIKVSLGKYSLNVPYETFWRRGIDDTGFQVLPIEVRHTAELIKLPFHHRDPFDRLLIAQAISENAPFASADGQLDSYAIRRIW